MKKKGNFKQLAFVLTASMMLALFAACGSKTTEASPEASDSGSATMVLRGGVIQTMDDERSTVSAIAVKDDKIVYVGDDAGVAEYIGNDTEVIELNGQMVLPGFIDSHIHEASGWIADMYQCNLANVDPTEEAYVAALKEFADANPDLPVIIGQSFQVKAFSDLGPTKEAIDSVISDRPVIVTDTSKHSYWANSAAIEMAGITEDTPDPDGGKIYRNDDGGIRGYFADVYMFNYIFSLSALNSRPQYRT